MFLLPLSFGILQIAQQDLVVDSCPEVSGFEKVHTVQIRDVHSSLIWRWAVRAIFLNVHPKKTHICSIYVLKRKQGFQSVWKGLSHLSSVNKPGGEKKVWVRKTGKSFPPTTGIAKHMATY